MVAEEKLLFTKSFPPLHATVMTFRNHIRHWAADEQLLLLMRCSLLAAAVILLGTLGFCLIEETWSYWDSFYFTVVTVSTVGYGDYEISENGRKFAALLILCGIGAFTYALTTIVQIASDAEAAVRRKMKRLISECRDHIVVCGYGRMGKMICEELDRSQIEVVVIECNEECVERAIADGRLVVEGIASQDETLLSAGIVHAQGIVCAVDSDAENMFVVISAQDLNPCVRIISRAESVDAARKLERAGAALVVSPHQMAGKTIATALLHPRLSRFLNSGDHDGLYFEMGEVEIEPGSNVEGKTVRQIGANLKGLSFVAIERKKNPQTEEELIVQPGGEFRFREGDVVIFAGAGNVVDQMRKAARKTRNREPVIV